MIPESVTIEQVSVAASAFCEALGFDAGAAYFPLIVTRDAIHFPAVPVAEDDPPKPHAKSALRLGLSHPQGDEGAVLACMVTIRVSDS